MTFELTIVSDFQTYLEESGEYGTAIEMHYPIVTVDGLPGCRIREVVVFETGERGQVFALFEDTVKILLLSPRPVLVGTKLTRTDDFTRVPVGPELLGAIIDPLGNPLSESVGRRRTKIFREIDTPPVSIYKRARIKKPLATGVSVVDLLIPLGRGQRQLILGDRKTGKSSFVYSAARKQVQEGNIVVIAAIGKKRSDIKKLYEELKKENLTKNIVVVATSSDQSPSLTFLAPYSAMTIAEYFRDLGHDTLLILDDLSTHARSYREISLLSGGFPGRDSYPGDIFYVQASLLERAGNFLHETKGEVSITCLPVVETVEGDLTSYLTTNVMGMTDGHIYFDAKAFVNGQRPPIDINLSVTRVGRQTQSTLKREIIGEALRFLTEYETAINYSQFGGELSPRIKHTVTKGEVLYAFFNQTSSVNVPEEIQLILFGLIWINLFNEYKGAKIDIVRKNLTDAYEKNPSARKLLKSVASVSTLYDLLLTITREREHIEALWLQESK